MWTHLCKQSHIMFNLERTIWITGFRISASPHPNELLMPVWTSESKMSPSGLYLPHCLGPIHGRHLVNIYLVKRFDRNVSNCLSKQQVAWAVWHRRSCPDVLHIPAKPCSVPKAVLSTQPLWTLGRLIPRRKCQTGREPLIISRNCMDAGWARCIMSH